MATRWRPDTCDCVVVYDGFDPVTDKPLGLVIEEDCGMHGAGLKPEELFERMAAYNRAVAAQRAKD